jgi:hypothetical protein
MPHLTRTEVQKYRRRKLPAEALLAVDDHVAACESCRQLLREHQPMADPIAVLAQLGETHLSYEEIELYVRGPARQEAWRRIESHLELCRQCREEVADLRKFRQQLQPRARRLPVWLSAAAAVAIAAGAVWWWSATHREPDLVARALATGDLHIPESLLALRGTRTIVRAPQTAPNFALVSPVATAVLSERPRFAWKPLTGATAYRAAVFAPGFHKVTESAWLESTAWTPPAPLARGQVFAWQVTARMGTGESASTVRAPALTDPEARFLVIGAADAAELERAAREHAGEHLLLGILYARAGLLDLAEQELAAEVAADPQSSQSKAVLAKIRALRR